MPKISMTILPSAEETAAKEKAQVKALQKAVDKAKIDELRAKDKSLTLADIMDMLVLIFERLP